MKSMLYLGEPHCTSCASRQPLGKGESIILQPTSAVCSQLQLTSQFPPQKLPLCLSALAKHWQDILLGPGLTVTWLTRNMWAVHTWLFCIANCEAGFSISGRPGEFQKALEQPSLAMWKHIIWSNLLSAEALRQQPTSLAQWAEAYMHARDQTLTCKVRAWWLVMPSPA